MAQAEKDTAEKKVVVITGASGGIGAAAARALARRGHSLALVARREKELGEVASDCGERALAIVADVSDRAQVTRAANEAIEHFGRVDGWVNNVGRGITRPPSELTDQDVDDMVRLNVKTVLYGIQAILPHFKSRGRGHIINVSSMLGRVPLAVYRSAYTGSKHFVNALTANLRAELREAYPEIVVTLVSPGVVETDFGRNAMHGGPDSRSLPYAQNVDEVGSVIAWAVETRVQDVYTRPGSRARVTEYFAGQGEDPPIEAMSWGRVPGMIR